MLVARWVLCSLAFGPREILLLAAVSTFKLVSVLIPPQQYVVTQSCIHVMLVKAQVTECPSNPFTHLQPHEPLLPTRQSQASTPPRPKAQHIRRPKSQIQRCPAPEADTLCKPAPCRDFRANSSLYTALCYCRKAHASCQEGSHQAHCLVSVVTQGRALF